MWGRKDWRMYARDVVMGHSCLHHLSWLYQSIFRQLCHSSLYWPSSERVSRVLSSDILSYLRCLTKRVVNVDLRRRRIDGCPRCYFVLKLKRWFYRRTIYFISAFYLYFELHVETNEILAPLKWRFNSNGEVRISLNRALPFSCPTIFPITVRWMWLGESSASNHQTQNQYSI